MKCFRVLALAAGCMAVGSAAWAQINSVEMARMARQQAAQKTSSGLEGKREQVKQALWDMGCYVHDDWLGEMSYWGNEEKIPWSSRAHIVATINALDRATEADHANARMLIKKLTEKNQLMRQLSLKGTDVGGMDAVSEQIASVRRDARQLEADLMGSKGSARCLKEFREKICEINSGTPEVAQACSGKFSMPEDIFQ